MTRARLALGARGEEAAASWYLAAGFEIEARNWRCPAGEIDLVARRGRLVCVCEVKTRSSMRFGAPAESVTVAKQRRLRRLAAAWLATTPRRAADVRFDVAEVSYGAGGRLEVNVIESAF